MAQIFDSYLMFRGYSLVLILFLLILVSPQTPAHSLADETDIFICGLNSDSMTSDNLGEILPGKTGNKQLDTAIENDALELQKTFGVSAKMFLLRESGGPNALAIQKPLPEVIYKFRVSPQSTSDGMIFFGIDLIRSQYNFFSKRGYAIPSIMSHEYAHLLQFKLNFPFRGRWQELHADFMAGWYTARRSRYAPQNVRESMTTFFDNGDYDFNSSQHHGSPEEREEAFMAGARLNFQYANMTGRDAYFRGLQFIRFKGAY